MRRVWPGRHVQKFSGTINRRARLSLRLAGSRSPSANPAKLSKPRRPPRRGFTFLARVVRVIHNYGTRFQVLREVDSKLPRGPGHLFRVNPRAILPDFSYKLPHRPRASLLQNNPVNRAFFGPNNVESGAAICALMSTRPNHSRRQLLANAAMAASRCRVPMVRRAIPVIAEGQGPHPRASYGRGVYLEDAADNFAVGEHVEIVVTPLTG